MRLRARRLMAEPALAPATVDMDGQVLPIVFRQNSRARRIIIRLSGEPLQIIATLPSRATRGQALEFIEKSRNWIRSRLSRQSQFIKVSTGVSVPVRGEPYEIQRVVGRRGMVLIDTRRCLLIVPCDPEHVGRRIGDWLSALAKKEFVDASRRYASTMGVRVGRISIRDQKSRWGSCSSNGSLSYSWRLIMAPSFVLEYVAAHEVAHLVHMNHGAKFWRLVLSHCSQARLARDWLKQHGSELHSYQF